MLQQRQFIGGCRSVNYRVRNEKINCSSSKVKPSSCRDRCRVRYCDTAAPKPGVTVCAWCFPSPVQVTFSWFTLLPKLFFLSLSVLLFYPSLRWSRAEKGLYCKSGFILTRLKKIILIWIPPSQLLLGWVVGEIPPSAFHLITSVITDVWIQWFFTGLSSGPSSTSLIHWWWLDMTLWCPQVQVPTPELLYGLISERMLFCFQMLHQFWQLTPSRASLHLTAPNTGPSPPFIHYTVSERLCFTIIYSYSALCKKLACLLLWHEMSSIDSLCITAPPTGKEYE